MNILILGGTGRVGRLVVQTALERQHRVTAIVRDLSRASLPGSTCLQGSPTDPELLEKVLEGINAVVVSLNINRTSDNPYARVVSPPTLISDTVKRLIPAMGLRGVKRIVTVSASGVGESWKDMPLFVRWFIRSSNIWKAYLDHERQETALKQSDLDWTIVRPVLLNDRENAGYKVSLGRPTGGYISRRGVAAFIVEALESGSHIHECVTLNA